MPIFKSETIKNKTDQMFFLRSFQITDSEALASFFQQSGLESSHTLHYKGRNFPISKIEERIASAIKSDFEIYLGIFNKDKIIAQIYFSVPSPDHPWIKHIGEFGMTVLKDYWGQGLGSELLKRIEVFAKSIDVSRIEARVRTTNERAISLYKKKDMRLKV